MRSPTFWILLFGMLVAWWTLADLNESSSDQRVNVRSGEFDFYVIHSAKPVLVSFEAEW